MAPTGSPAVAPVALRRNPASNETTAGACDKPPGRRRPNPASSKMTSAVANEVAFIVNMKSSSDTNPTLWDTDPITVM